MHQDSYRGPQFVLFGKVLDKEVEKYGFWGSIIVILLLLLACIFCLNCCCWSAPIIPKGRVAAKKEDIEMKNEEVKE